MTATTTREDRVTAPFAAGNTNELIGIELPTRRRWPLLVAGAALGVAGTFGVLAYTDNGDASGTAESAVDVQLTTAPVEVRDLVDEVEWSAELGYGTPVDVTAAVDGTITDAVDAGAVLGRGDTLMTVGSDPVVILYSELPFWRNLSEGAEGPDVEQLETNLVALGYDPDATVTIDDQYTFNTALMVERWQEDIGAEVDGIFTMADVVVVPGPVSVTAPPVVGLNVRSAAPVASLSTRLETSTIVGSAVGEVASVAALGTAVEHGTILYEADGIEVMALTSVDAIASLLIGAAEPAALEVALAFAGFDPDAQMSIDDVIDDTTEAAVARWQADVGLPTTGHTTPDAYVVVPSDVQVSQRFVSEGAVLTTERPVLELAAPTLSVTIPVALAEQDEFVAGQLVSVQLPDDSIVGATVVSVGTLAITAAPGEDPTIEVTVEINELVAEDLPASEVTVIVAGETIEDALVVPTRALLSLSEGGFAVEKVLDDGRTILVAIETGTFDDGLVEVDTNQLEPGDELVVPS